MRSSSGLCAQLKHVVSQLQSLIGLSPDANQAIAGPTWAEEKKLMCGHSNCGTHDSLPCFRVAQWTRARPRQWHFYSHAHLQQE